MQKRLLKFFVITFIADITSSWGQSTHACESLIRQYEAAHGIPNKLLTAISLVESGRKINGSVVAWPWSINANGKPYVFATKWEAISMVRKLRHKGITSIDVGCMQVNLKQHPDAFPTLDAAFDPATNIAYAAQFLKTKKNNMGTWANAVGHYHSATAKFHVPYKARVLKTWAKVQNGRLTLNKTLDTLSTTLILEELEKHRGEFVNTVAAPSGRKISMLVRFAPYKGSKWAEKDTRRLSKNAPIPIVFIDGRAKTIGKVIINKLMIRSQNASRVTGEDFSNLVIHMSTKSKPHR